MLDYIIYLLGVLWALFLGRNDEEQFEQGNPSTASCRKSPMKGPQVATIVLGERDGRRINIQKVARLIHWCTLEDLQYIFLYDPEGHIKSQKHALQVAMESEKQAGRNYQLKCGWQEMMKEKGRTTASIFPVMPNMTFVHILDESDSLMPIVNAAKKPPQGENLQNLKKEKENTAPPHHPFFDSQVHLDSLKEQITDVYGASATLEPKIVFVLGEVFSPAGCPPWHLKSSEIYYLGNLESLVMERLTSVWERYYKTVQRFGK